MTKFHSDDYIRFLRSIRPDNMAEYNKQMQRCKYTKIIIAMQKAILSGKICLYFRNKYSETCATDAISVGENLLIVA